VATKILVVDDDKSILGTIRRYLSANGLSCVATDNGSEALLLVRESQPDLILVDAEMPGLDGHSICRVLKKEAATQSIPVIIMSGERIEEKDILAGFSGGADDYMLKPFSLQVLLARIQAVLRRAMPGGEEEKLAVGGLEVDAASQRVSAKGEPVRLGPTEYRLLHFFVSHPERVYTREQVLDRVWGQNVYVEERTVDVHIRRLRKALEPYGYADMIQTVRGTGRRRAHPLPRNPEVPGVGVAHGQAVAVVILQPFS